MALFWESPIWQAFFLRFFKFCLGTIWCLWGLFINSIFYKCPEAEGEIICLGVFQSFSNSLPGSYLKFFSSLNQGQQESILSENFSNNCSSNPTPLAWSSFWRPRTIACLEFSSPIFCWQTLSGISAGSALNLARILSHLQQHFKKWSLKPALA